MTIAVSNRSALRQGTKVWKDLRSCFITGSQFKAFSRPASSAIYKKVVQEKRDYWGGVHSTNPLALDRTMEWGTFHEDVAREAYKKHLESTRKPGTVNVHTEVSMLIDEGGMIATSPDGVVTIENEPRGVIEIKCPPGFFFFKVRDVGDPKYDVRTLNDEGREELYKSMKGLTEVGAKYYDMDNQFRLGGKLEDHYLQCLGNLHLSEAQWLDYIVFVPYKQWYKGSNIRVKRITRDETLADWERSRDALVAAYRENHDVFTSNIEKYLEEHKGSDTTIT